MANKVNLAIPIYGKLGIRSYHSPKFWAVLARHRLEPKYFLGPTYFEHVELDPTRYFRLEVDEHDRYLKRHKALKVAAEVRRFAVRTETTDLRFRERIEAMLFDHKPVSTAWGYAAVFDGVRHIPGVSRAACWFENAFYKTSFYDKSLDEAGIGAVLTPGIGGYGFYNECIFGREAQRRGIPVFASITNYDNVVNRGYRGYDPAAVGVWSKAMAEDTIRLQGVPARRVEVVGPVQYDRYFLPVATTREEFLRSKGLDPKRKTVLYAGGVMITRYFEIYKLLIEGKKASERPNLIVRAYPHGKLLETPQWQVLEKMLMSCENVYVSNSLQSSADDFVAADLARDVNLDSDLDELHCLFRFSDVMVNHFSTVSLEAAICDLPTIHMAYDKYMYGHLYGASAAFQRRQTHNRRELRLRAARIANDEKELLKQLDEYLADHSLDAEARHEYALYECGFLDGKSSERLGAMIESRVK